MARIRGLEIDCDDSGCYSDVEFYGNMDVYEILKASGAKPSELDDRLILIYEKEISSVSAVVKALELALKRQRPLLIVAEDVDSEALATLILNKLRSGIKICAVKAPGFVENMKAGLQDLATLIGEESVLKSAAAHMMGALSALRSMMSKSV